MKDKTARRLRDVIAIAGIIIMLCGYVYEPLLFVGGAVAFSCLIPHFLYNKCPYCKKQLGRDVGKHCRHCGKELD